jgi:hypothetical protein
MAVACLRSTEEPLCNLHHPRCQSLAGAEVLLTTTYSDTECTSAESSLLGFRPHQGWHQQAGADTPLDPNMRITHAQGHEQLHASFISVKSDGLAVVKGDSSRGWRTVAACARESVDACAVGAGRWRWCRGNCRRHCCCRGCLCMSSVVCVRPRTDIPPLRPASRPPG